MTYEHIQPHNSLKRSVEDYCANLDSVSKALDQMQATKKNLSDAVVIWHELIEKLARVYN